jgi:hypothetical protein
VRPSRKTWVTTALLSAALVAATLPAAAPAAGLTLAVTTLSPSAVTPDGAVLQASVLVSALGASVNFQYGTTTGYGSVSGASATSLLGVGQTLAVPVSGLQPATTYHVRAKATSLLSTVYGRDLVFTTPALSAAPSTEAPDDSSDAPAAPTTGSPVPTVPAPTVPGLTAPGTKAPGTKAPTGGSTPGSTTTAGGAATDPGAAPGDAPAPALGRTIGVETVRGSVTVTTPSGSPVDLATATPLPTGSVIDTRKGTVALTSAVDRKGTVQTGQFWGGVFEVRQSPTAKGLTQLVLRGGDFSSCHAAATRGAAAHAAKAAKPPRALWGSDHNGRFQTRGRGSVATVRGTRWYTEDRCAGTLTRVTEGAVSVYDAGRHHTTTVTRGHEYLARIAR